MQIRSRSRLSLCLLLVTFLAAAQEPTKPQLNPRVITATRQVVIFTDLENKMLRAVQAKDRPTLSGLVLDDCSIQMPDADPLAADDWMESVMDKGYRLKSFQVRQLSAVDLRDYVVVSFGRVEQSSINGKPGGGEFFVVDLWKKDGDAWKLANRYVAKVSSVPWKPKADVRPTGK